MSIIIYNRLMLALQFRDANTKIKKWWNTLVDPLCINRRETARLTQSCILCQSDLYFRVNIDGFEYYSHDPTHHHTCQLCMRRFRPHSDKYYFEPPQYCLFYLQGANFVDMGWYFGDKLERYCKLKAFW